MARLWVDLLGRETIGGREYIAGAFRGAVFFVESSELGGGRRAEENAIPYQNDDPVYVEDLGRKGRRFRVDGYVLGSNYLSQRNALIDALEEEGPGELRHPYHGKRRAICTDFSCQESTKDGGMARFSMEFLETAERPDFPTATVDPPAALKTLSGLAFPSLRSELLKAYNATGIQADFLVPIENLIADAARGAGGLSSLVQTARDLASFRQRLNRLVDNAAALVRNPGGVFDQIVGLLEYTFAPPTVPGPFRDLFDGLDFAAKSAPSSPFATNSRERQTELHLVLGRAMRRAMLFRYTEIAADAEFEVFVDATSVRTSLLRKIDEEIEDADDAVIQLLQDLRTGAERAIPKNTERLRSRKTFVPIITEPSVVIAHRIYGDTSRELELVSRNAVKHPGFIVGGRPLEVLVDG